MAVFSGWVWRMAWRDSRTSRRHLLLFSTSISLGIAALVAIGSLGRNLQRAIQEQAKSLLGADLVLTSRQPPSPELASAVERLPGEAARETSFSTMLVVSNATRLVNARALEGGFPFYGTIESEPPDAAAGLALGGGVLVDEGVMLQLGLRPGDPVQLGRTTFRVLGALRRMPGDTLSVATLAPRVYLAARDLPSTGLLQAGSLARYRFHFRFPPEVDVTALETTWAPEWRRLRLESETVSGRQEDLGNALENLYRFLNLVALVALILGAVGIASALHAHLQQKLAHAAILRCLGTPLPDTFAIYLAQALGLGAVGTATGIALGAGVAARLPGVVRSFIPFTWSASFDWTGATVAALTGFLLSALFGLLPLLAVRRVPPLAALRAAFQEPPGPDPAPRVLMALIALGVTAFALAQTRRWQEGLGVAAGLAVAFLVLAAAGRGLSWAARRWAPPGLPFPWRQGLANLHRPNNRTTLLLVALGLGSFLLLTLQLTRDTLLHQLFPNAPSWRPNAILFDIQPDQRDGVIATLHRLGLPVLDEAPVVTMRLAEVKGRSAESLAKESVPRRGEAARRGRGGGGIPDWVLRREYRTTWRTQLNETESLVAGVWTPTVHAPTESGQPIPISLEARIAEDLQVTVGDPIVWDVQGVPLPTVVGSLRQVDWRQVRPNFFVLFPGGALEAAPAMHLIATRVGSPEESARMQQALVREFPNVSAMDLALVLQTLDRVLTQVGLVVRFMALFTVATGLIVLAGAVLAGRWQRVQESILLRTLGADRRQIRNILMAEYIALGALAGLLAVFLAVGSSWSLARFALESEFLLSWTPLLVTLVAVPALTLLVGLATSRGIADQPPLEILRRES